MWRGGLPLKSVAGIDRPADTNANGATSDDPMTISSDDEEQSNGTDQFHEIPAEFEDQEEEYDPLRPYAPIVQTLDLPLGTKVLRLSFLRLPAELQQSSLGSLPQMLLEKVVVAVACSDHSVRLLTIPLTPPSEFNRVKPEIRGNDSRASARKGLYGAQMINLTSDRSHRSLVQGVSMTLTANLTTSTGSNDRSDYDDKIWDLLVASHSADISGLLLVHKITILPDGSELEADPDSDRPWRSQYLPFSATAISFNPSSYPATRHSQVLIADARGAVSIYDCLPQSDAGRGSWLISLHPGFEADTAQPRQLLTAHWVLGGRAIAVLLANGEWGIWDLEDGAPKAKKGTDGWQASSSVSLANFTLTGWIGHLSETKQEGKKQSFRTSKTQLAPMTPATRQVRQETLFAGPASKDGSTARGGISICTASDSLDGRRDDETLLLWHGSSVLVIASLLTYWKNKIKGSGNLFGNGAQGQPRQLNNITLGGEVRNDVSLIPPSLSLGTKTKPSSVLITGERRIMIVGPPLSEVSSPPPINDPKLSVRSIATDEAMLARGELDVDGIDTFLTRMSNGNQINGTQFNYSKERNNIPRTI